MPGLTEEELRKYVSKLPLPPFPDGSSPDDLSLTMAQGTAAGGMDIGQPEREPAQDTGSMSTAQKLAELLEIAREQKDMIEQLVNNSNEVTDLLTRTFGA